MLLFPRTSDFEISAMAQRQFAHLHTHYSLLDEFNRIPTLVEQTKKLGMNAVAITDHGNLYGAIEFYEGSLCLSL